MLSLNSRATRKNSTEAASYRTPFAAIIAKSNIPEEQRNIPLGVVANAVSLQRANLTDAEVDAIERCCKEARGHPD